MDEAWPPAAPNASLKYIPLETGPAVPATLVQPYELFDQVDHPLARLLEQLGLHDLLTQACCAPKTLSVPTPADSYCLSL